MVRLNPVSGRKLLQKMKRAGFVVGHQQGSHVFLSNSDSTRKIVIPFHASRDISIGTLYSIVVKQAGLTIEEFNNL